MGRKTKYTSLQRTHSDGQQTHERMLNTVITAAAAAAEALSRVRLRATP